MIKDGVIIFAFLGVVTSVGYYVLHKDEGVKEKPEKLLSVQIVNYPKQNISISRQLYIKALLDSVMDVTELEYGPYKINIIDTNLVPLRIGVEMKKGNRINLIWEADEGNNGQDLIKVPFHTMKGILGYRVLIIRADRQDEFSKITNLEQLQKMKPGQVEFWTDTAIYKNNNFEVVTSYEMASLYPMLENNRFDFLPLGVSEVNQEYLLNRLKYRSLAIETDLLIKYSLHMLFMVSPTEPTLAERLHKGLKEIEKSGEFDRIFNEFIQPEKQAVKMLSRRVIHLKN